MAIDVNCGCGQQFEVEDDVAGGEAPCPACGLPVPVPEGKRRVALSTMKLLNVPLPDGPEPTKEELLERARQRGKGMTSQKPVVNGVILVALGAGLLAGAMLAGILNESLLVQVLLALVGLPVLGKGIFDMINERTEEARTQEMEAARRGKQAPPSDPVEPR